jgi:hypothetical protein
MASQSQANLLFSRFCDFDPEAEAQVAGILRRAGLPFRAKLGDTLEDIERNLLLGLREKECKNPHFEITVSLQAYLGRSMRNKCLTAIYDGEAHAKLRFDNRYRDREPDQLSEDMKIKVRDLWQTLSERCRDLLDLHLRGYSYEEIGRLLPRKDGKPQAKGTVGADLFHCKEHARVLAEKAGIAYQSFARP